MPKNITVTDAQGNLYQPTYAKRAKGLVKHNRAVYLDENTICLTCPPCQTEENAMTANDILKKIEELSLNTKHIDDALAALQAMPPTPESKPYAPPDVAGEAKAKAISDVVRSAEDTRQHVINFYIQLYNELHSSTPNE